jgi:hypothetical protein
MSQIESYTLKEQEVKDNRDLLVRLASVKNKDILRDTLNEHQRRGNFVRVYPAKGTDCYDHYFAQARPLNRYLYKMLYSDELIGGKQKEIAKLGYMVEVPKPYDYYRNKAVKTIE